MSSTSSLLYRRIEAIGTLTVSLWVGTMLTTAAVIVSGAAHFDAARAFDFPPGAFDFSLGFLLGLGAASRVGIYDYLGYYDICYIGDEVKDPGRVIPRSILISIIAVAAIYLAINLSIIGVVPWREFVPADAHPESEFIVSTFMERLYGTAGRDRLHVPDPVDRVRIRVRAAAGVLAHPVRGGQDGCFFSVFGRLHPTKRFPHVSLIVLGGISILCSLLPLGLVIDALITTRILVQFIGQVFAVMLLRASRPDMPRPFRMWLYPVPAIVALAGWIFLLLTSGWFLVALGLGTLALGIVCFLVWSWRSRSGPLSPGIRLQTEGKDSHD